MNDNDRKFTSEECQRRRDQIRRFEINLPEMLPRAEWPRPHDPRDEPTESDLLFAHLFLLAGWPPTGSDDQPPDFPLALLPDTKSPGDVNYEKFFSAVEWMVESSLAAHHAMLAAFGTPRVRTPMRWAERRKRR